jgi:hypothetical protein
MLGNAMPATTAVLDIVATAPREASATASGSGTDSAACDGDSCVMTPATPAAAGASCCAAFCAFFLASFLRFDAASSSSSSSSSSSFFAAYVSVCASPLMPIASSVAVPSSAAVAPPSPSTAGIATVLTFQTYAQSAAPTAMPMTAKMTFDA